MAIKLEAARGDFSAFGGLKLFDEMMAAMGMGRKLKPVLPERKRKSNATSYDKFKALVMGFVSGAECLDDMDVLARDPGFAAACDNKLQTAPRYGNFLRSFAPWQRRRLNEMLKNFALNIRAVKYGNERDFILDIDSTMHRQCARKMEGLGYDYKGVWGLSSLQAFDQFGIQYWMDVRHGSEFTANGTSSVIRHVFKGLPRKMNRIMRADSGMCNAEVMNACVDLRADFVICMRANLSDPLRHRVFHWKKAKKTEFRDGRDCEIGSTVFYPKWAKQAYRVIFIRARKPQPDIFDLDPYDYRAWVTSFGTHEMKDEDVIDFYKKRGNAENFIRELKNGYDIHHFPCKSLLANKVYGIIAAFAHNLMRLASSLHDSKKLRYAKHIRFRMVYLACQVVRKSRYTIFRMNPNNRKEMDTWITTFRTQRDTG